MDIRSLLTAPLWEAGPIRLVAWEVIYVVVLMLILVAILKRALFRPILAVLDERQRRLVSAQAAQENALRSLEEQSARYAEQVAAARREAQARLVVARSDADAEGRAHVDEAQHAAQGQVSIARDIVDRSSRKAEAELKSKAPEMAKLIASRMLDRVVA
jgi:F-type H+-transporting ATPase subunit b